MNFITGEKIQFLCNHFIGTQKDFEFNPNVLKYKDKFIFIGTNKEINNKPLIFCYTHLLDNINDLINTLKNMKNIFKLVFHNSDKNFNNEHIILFDRLPLLECIFTQNMKILHEKVFPLPIGLANSQWIHGNNSLHKKIYQTNIEKTKKIYFNFSKNTNLLKRNECYNCIIIKNIKWNPNLPYEEYLIELKRHKYAICPEGNGIDTHRFWECLYMNTIPICLKNTLTEYYKNFFPIILLNNWAELEESNLVYSNINHYYLNLQNFSLSNVFDIVIPVGPNDKTIIKEQIKYTKKNIIGYRNIYLICYDPSITINGCITINENIFPFNIETVSNFHGKLNRNGWYLQQLFKLYAGKIIPNILEKYLVIDSDTFFLKPTTFIYNGICLYNYGSEYHKPYFDHMNKLDKDLIKMNRLSGICHHMIFETKYIDELFLRIENNHKDTFYNIFLKMVSMKEKSGASEYEIYFNYMLKYNPTKIKIRELTWKNTDKLELNNNLHYISYHWYSRK